MIFSGGSAAQVSTNTKGERTKSVWVSWPSNSLTRKKGTQGTHLRTRYPRQRSSEGRETRTLGQEEDQGSKLVLLRALGVCV